MPVTRATCRRELVEGALLLHSDRQKEEMLVGVISISFIILQTYRRNVVLYTRCLTFPLETKALKFLLPFMTINFL